MTTDLKTIGYDRLTKDYMATYDGNVIGFFGSYSAAEEALNDYVLLLCEQGMIDQPLAALAEQALTAASPPEPASPVDDGDRITDRLVEMAEQYKRLIAAGKYEEALALNIDGRKLVWARAPGVLAVGLAALDDPPPADDDPEAVNWNSKCRNCDGPHHIQQCPEIWQALRAPALPATARQWLSEDWRRDAIARAWSRKLLAAADASAESYAGIAKAPV